MDNYRKRQQRLADERISAEKRRLLTSFLGVVDNLERIVAHLKPNDPYQQSIQVTYDEMMKLLRVEGVEPIDATGTPFDPLQHEAVAMVPAQAGQGDDIIVLKEERKGYRLGDQVLRPAQVVVAKS
jgi:molecular chaperone GrpE